MRQWRVRNVMTANVVTVSDNATVSDIAALLTRRRISAVPVVDQFDGVIGVVSWTDLHDKVEVEGPDSAPRRGWFNRRRSRPRWPQGTAAEVMSAPPITIGLDASLATASRAMHRRKVGRLLVVEGGGRLVGVVTRTDLLKVHGRLDAVVLDEITQAVLGRTLMIEAGTVKADVNDGVVTLTGRTRRKTTALAAVALTEAVAGVTAVIDRLGFDTDDTVTARLVEQH